MRTPLSNLLLPAALALASCTGPAEPQRAQNVLLIVCDTLRSDRLGCYGYGRPTSPHIDALAERGTLYENAYSNASWTVPSMISMLSGVPVTKSETTLPEGLPVLAELLKTKGFETAAFPANAVLRYDRGFDRGFDLFEDVSGRTGPEVAERFGAWLAERASASDRPERFFAWVQFIDPHEPYAPLPEFDRFDGPREDQERLEARWRAAHPELERHAPGGEHAALEEAVAAMVDTSNRYDGEVLQTDAGVGALVAHLRSAGVLEDTLIVLASDHGEMLYEQPVEPYLVQDVVTKTGTLAGGVADLFGCGHRWWFYENLWNTPLIVAGPGFPAGERKSGLAQNLDIFPTVLEALDLAAPPYLAGSSLYGGRDPAYERLHALGHGTYAVREDSGWKLALHPRKLYLLEGEGEAPARLVDLGADPLEERDASAAHAARVAELSDSIAAWRERHDREVNSETTARALEDLRRLGYVDGGPVDSGPDEGGDL